MLASMSAPLTTERIDVDSLLISYFDGFARAVRSRPRKARWLVPGYNLNYAIRSKCASFRSHLIKDCIRAAIPNFADVNLADHFEFYGFGKGGVKKKHFGCVRLQRGSRLHGDISRVF